MLHRATFFFFPKSSPKRCYQKNLCISTKDEQDPLQSKATQNGSLPFHLLDHYCKVKHFFYDIGRLKYFRIEGISLCRCSSKIIVSQTNSKVKLSVTEVKTIELSCSQLATRMYVFLSLK